MDLLQTHFHASIFNSDSHHYNYRIIFIHIGIHIIVSAVPSKQPFLVGHLSDIDKIRRINQLDDFLNEFLVTSLSRVTGSGNAQSSTQDVRSVEAKKYGRRERGAP